MNNKLMRAMAFTTALAITASAMSLSVYAAPAKYSSVEQGYITPVKNQGQWGICWAFSSTAISEASLIKEFPDKYKADTLDLSENLFSYMISHPSVYGKLNSSGDYAKYTASSNTEYLTAGGNVWNAGLALMNGIGPYYENSQYPYSSYGTPGIVNKSFTESEYYELRDSGMAKLTGLYVANINQNNSNNQLKELILTYGAASLSYCDTTNYGRTDGKFGDDGSSYYYYCPEEYTSNHAVTVVGWDDSIPASAFKTAPAGNGAWLIKNSWGDDSRDNGYFWLSYYDKSIMSSGVAYDYTVDGADDYYNTLYSYDGGNSSSWFGYGLSTMYGANVFTAENASNITGAAVYTSKGMDIELSVYTGLKDKTNPTSGTKAATATKENVGYEGYYSLQFDSSVKVQKGDTFAIVAKITNNSGSAMIYSEYGYPMNGLTYTLNANKGESYYTYDPNSFWDDCANNKKNNLMIKAYAVNAECAEHTYGDWITDTAATCTKDGAKHRACKKCGAVENGVIEKLGHNYSAEWTVDKPADCKNSGEESRHCTRCDARTDIKSIPATGKHTYGDWITDTAATCTKDGAKHRVCKKCGAVENGIIEKLGHNYSAEWTVDKPADCKNSGKKSRHCTRCDARTDIISIPSTGKHTYGDWQTLRAATCTEEGERIRYCLGGCGTSEKEVIDALGHDYSTEWTIDVSATCKNDGLKSHHCKRCDERTDLTAVPKTNDHKFGEWIIKKEANCTESGYKVRQCLNGCGTSEECVTAPLGHKYVDTVVKPTYAAQGYTLHKCSVCGASYKDNETAKLTLAKVTGFKVKSLTSTNVTLQWNKNANASGYEIEHHKGGKWVNVAKITSNATTSYTVKGLAAGTAGYKFRMRAVKDGAYSDYTSALSVNTNPYGVGGFKCSSKSSTSVTLKWNKGTTASGYQLQQYKDGKWVTIYTGTKATDTSYTVKKLKAGTAGYRFRIRAYKTYGNTKQYGSWSSEVKVNTNPYGVGGFKCSSKTSTSVTLKWNKGTTASGYQLQQYKDGKWVTIYTGTKATNTSYTVKGLKAGTAGYRFRIRAYKTYGNTKQYGSWSSEVKVNTNPYGVSGFKCSSKSSTSVTLKWNKGTTASGYQLQQYKDGKWVTIYTGTKATNTSYTVKGLKAGTAGYRFRIRAYKTYGNTKQYGSWSSEVKVNTNPYGVGGFKAKSKSYNSITLQWNKNTSATGYELQKWNGKKWVALTKIAKNSTTTYTVKNLKASTTYKYRIRAYKTIGKATQYSAYSATLSANTIPTNVSRFRLNSKTGKMLNLGWDMSDDAAGYIVQQYKGGKWVQVAKLGKSKDRVRINDLSPSTTYKFRIRKYASIGKTTVYGNWSYKSFKTEGKDCVDEVKFTPRGEKIDTFVAAHMDEVWNEAYFDKPKEVWTKSEILRARKYPIPMYGVIQVQYWFADPLTIIGETDNGYYITSNNYYIYSEYVVESKDPPELGTGIEPIPHY